MKNRLQVRIRLRIKPSRISSLSGNVKRYVNTVEALPVSDTANDLDDFYLYDSDEAALQAMSDWVDEHKLGRRISYNTWKMHTGDAVTMFLLKWNV